MATIEMDTRRLESLIRQCPEIAHEVALTLGFSVEAHAKIRAAVDTSFMRNAIYVNAQGHEGYEAAEAAAKAVNESAKMNPPDPVPSKGTVEVLAGAEYSVFVENGTSTQGAQPFMTPAVAETEASMLDIAGRILQKRIDGAG